MISQSKKLDVLDMVAEGMTVGQPLGALKIPKKEATGNVLSLHDAEMKLINSSALGMRRLASARALDIQELVPNLSDRDAQIIGAGYVMLRLQGANGGLIETTHAEVQRVDARKRIL